MTEGNADQSITATVANAKKLLFDKNGKHAGLERYLDILTLKYVLRPATPSEKIRPRSGYTYFDWRGKLLVYDAGISELFLADARAGDPSADKILSNAAAIILDATGGIPNARLRSYICGRLNGGIKVSKTRSRGRSRAENAYRDLVIVNGLVRPLLSDFRATRNEATEEECACSIVSKALARVGISLSEKRVAEIWGRVARNFKPTA